jgi:hypothetical protein
MAATLEKKEENSFASGFPIPQLNGVKQEVKPNVQ